MRPQSNLSYLIQHLAAVLNKQADYLLQKHLNIGMSQYRILMVLEWNPRIGQRAIADSLGQTEASISRQIRLLIDKGLLISKPDPLNRRKHITAPSLKGMKVTEAANDMLKRDFSADTSKLSSHQQLQLANDLQLLHKSICRPGKLGACDHQLGL